jgi:WD40 repeat protein
LRRTVLSRDGYTLEALDFFKIAIKKQGQPQLVFESPRKGDRIYSMTLMPGERAVMGGSFGLYLVDLKTAKVMREFIGHSGLILATTPTPDGRFFVTGGTDQTICFWNPERAEPLFSFFVAGRDWIAWTPEGYYAASPYGERLMGWQINQGPDKMALFYPAVQFRASLYQPEVVRNLPRTGTCRMPSPWR